MTSKHITEEWKVFGEKSNIIITAKFLNGIDPYRMPIAYIQTEDNCPDTMARAKLMATAPKLLAACESVAMWLEEASKYTSMSSLTPTAHTLELLKTSGFPHNANILRNAIQQAKGE